ncbi:MAG: hypothetical protein AAF487_08275 [Bacteroidota bacterium]
MQRKQCLIIGIALSIFSCSPNTVQKTLEEKEVFENDCGCNLTEKEMLNKLPIAAMGDSLVICKLGTTKIIGSGLGYITWLEALQSKYNGGEGQVYNCVTNENFKRKFLKRKLEYKDKSLFMYYRFPVNVYDTINKVWVDLDIETYMQKIYAKKDSIFYSDVKLAFKPPFHTQEAFDSALEEYELESGRKNHYLISRTVKRLFVSAINGDQKAREKFLEIPIEFKDYYDHHEDAAQRYDVYSQLLTDYEHFLSEGGEREYYDLTIFPYFLDPERYKD